MYILEIGDLKGNNSYPDNFDLEINSMKEWMQRNLYYFRVRAT